jgi:serine/threonine-protein kinase
MSPEQIAGVQDLDGRSDVWSTGVLLYELLCGRKPFDGEGLTTVIAGILREQPPALEARVPGLPKALLDVVSKALEKDRDKRFQNAEQLGRELQLIRKTHQLSAPPPMDETRMASTKVLQALHEDRQKQDQGRSATGRCSSPRGGVAAATPPSGSKLMIAAAAVPGDRRRRRLFAMQSPRRPERRSQAAPRPAAVPQQATPPSRPGNEQHGKPGSPRRRHRPRKRPREGGATPAAAPGPASHCSRPPAPVRTVAV